jgi:hypothetical protein
MKNPKPLPPLESLLCWFRIDGPDLVWRESYFPDLVGKRAGYQRPDGYIEVQKSGYKMLAHRVVYALANGVDPGGSFVDHIDGNPSNNSPANLRLASHAENLRNCRRLRRNNTSGRVGVRHAVVNGVAYWKAEFNHEGKTYFVGAYATKEEAVAAREVAERFVYGDFAPLASLPTQALFPSTPGA